MHLHRYREVRNTGKWSYRACRCGKRKIVQVAHGGHQPVDRKWVESGVFRNAPTEPPPKPSDARRSATPPNVSAPMLNVEPRRPSPMQRSV